MLTRRAFGRTIPTMRDLSLTQPGKCVTKPCSGRDYPLLVSSDKFPANKRTLGFEGSPANPKRKTRQNVRKRKARAAQRPSLAPKPTEEDQRKAKGIKRILAYAHERRRLRHRLASGAPEMACVGFSVFKSDVRVHWKSVDERENHGGGDRGIIHERSKKSRMSLAFTVANTPTTIVGMKTLTWRIAPENGTEVKWCLTTYFDAVRREFGKSIEWLWWLEFMESGAPHVHVLTAGTIHDTFAIERFGEREVFRGEAEKWCGQKWLSVIGASHCVESQAFTAGGIWERIRERDGAARYVAKDAWKPYQTKVPEGYRNVGAWWHRSRGFLKPQPLRTVIMGEARTRKALQIADGEALYPVCFNKAKVFQK